MLLECIFGRHKRDGRLVRDTGSAYVSSCRDCGAPLIKGGDGHWRRDRRSKAERHATGPAPAPVMALDASARPASREGA